LGNQTPHTPEAYTELQPQKKSQKKKPVLQKAEKVIIEGQIRFPPSARTMNRLALSWSLDKTLDTLERAIHVDNESGATDSKRRKNRAHRDTGDMGDTNVSLTKAGGEKKGSYEGKK